MLFFLRKASTSASASVHAAAQQLLPPIPLYRRLLRVHRYALPREMRSLGDQYVKDEFRRHRTTDNPLHIVGFLSQWKYYLDDLESSLSSPSTLHRGRKLEPQLLEKLSAQQVGQLYELLEATKSLYSQDSRSCNNTQDKE